MIEIWQAIVGGAVAVLITALVTGFGMTVGFDKRIALMSAEFSSFREMMKLEMTNLRAEMVSRMRDIKDSLNKHDEEIRRLDRAEHNGGFQPARDRKGER